MRFKTPPRETLRSIGKLQKEVYACFTRTFEKAGFKVVEGFDRIMIAPVLEGVGTSFRPSFEVSSSPFTRSVVVNVVIRFDHEGEIFGTWGRHAKFTKEFTLAGTPSVRKAANMAVKFLRDGAKRDSVRAVMNS